MAVQITTNHNHRDVLDASDLTAKERENFDYLDWEAIEKGEESASFFRYRGECYDLGDIESTSSLGIPNELSAKWDGYASDSFFSGIVVKYVDDFEGVVVGRYFYSD